MKTLKSLIIVVCLTGCSYQQIATLNMASSRNIDQSENYILLGREVKGKGKEKNHDALQRALDDAVLHYKTGEFMMNVRVYVNSSGSKVKVEGDVWGRDTTRVR